MGFKKTSFVVAMGVFMLSLQGVVSAPNRMRSIRHSQRAALGMYHSWIVLFTAAGTLAVVAAIAVTEGFIAQSLLLLTVGEWELLAILFYVIAVLLYLGEGSTRRTG